MNERTGIIGIEAGEHPLAFRIALGVVAVDKEIGDSIIVLFTQGIAVSRISYFNARTVFSAYIECFLPEFSATWQY